MADEEMGLDAQSVEHAGKLDGDVPSTHNGDLLGQGLNVEEAIAVDAVLGTGDRGWGVRLATDGDEDLLGVDDDLGAVVLCDLDLVLGEEPAPAREVLDLVIAQVALVDAVEALDVGVALVLEVVPVEGGGLLDGEAVGFGVADGLGEGGGVVGDLFRNASVERNSLDLSFG